MSDKKHIRNQLRKEFNKYISEKPQPHQRHEGFIDGFEKACDLIEAGEPHRRNTALGTMLAKMKKWNWSLFFVVICVSEMGAMGNENIESFGSAFLFGLIAGIVLGLPMAILTKDAER